MAFALLGIQAILLFHAAWRTGMTYDELPRIAHSVKAIRMGRVPVIFDQHPPLWTWIRGIALAPLNLTLPPPHVASGFDRDFRFIFQSGDYLLHSQTYSEEFILLAARSAGILLAILAGFVLYWFSLLWFGEIPALFALAFYVFEPNILAHASLANYDMPLASMTLISLCFAMWPASGPLTTFLAGSFASAAALTKQPGLVVFAGVLGILFFREKGRVTFFGVGSALVFLMGIMLHTPREIWGAYQTRFFQSGIFSFGLLLSWFHLISAKITPALALSLVGAGIGFRRWAFSPVAKAFLALAAFYLILSVSSIGFGLAIKFLLPSLCLLYPVIACAAASSRFLRQALPTLIFLQIASCALAFPNWLTYFNFSASRGTLIFSQSNGDWGQSLKALGRLRRSMPESHWVLAYHGTDNPDVHVGRFQDIYSAPLLKVRGAANPEKSQRKILAVSRSYRIGMRVPPNMDWSWLKDLPHIATVEDTIDLYDISGSTLARLHITNISEALKRMR